MKLLMVINTSGLGYDDRPRKEALSLRSLGLEVEILAMEYANEAGRAAVYEDVCATTIRLRSRQWFGRTKGLWLKAPEMYARFLAGILRSRPDIVWIHNLELAALVPFLAGLRGCGFVRRLIWDQHELPPDRLLGSRSFLRLFAWLLNRCDHIIMANEERKQLIQRTLGRDLDAKVEVLSNYPDGEFINLRSTALPTEVREWLAGGRYLLAQGGANPGRHLGELVQALLSTSVLKLIVIGPYSPEQVNELNAKCGGSISDRVLFTGFVPQMDMVRYIDHALASIVFYDRKITNSNLCAPNRLYQAISRGVPVIVSTNPPLTALVERCRCGIAVEPSSPGQIAAAIQQLAANERMYREGAAAHSGSFLWESQTDVLRRVTLASEGNA